MSDEPLNSPELPATSLGAKMLNLFVSPKIVFEEIVNSPSSARNWLAPTILASASSVFALEATTAPDRISAVIGGLLNSGSVSQIQAAALMAHWHAVSRFATCAAVFAGTIWSASALWLIGRFLLRRKFAFAKTLEVVGLTSTILILGGLVTGLLAMAVGDPAAQPALSLLCSKLDPANPIRAISAILNVFHLWAASVLAIGLARLSGVMVFEAGFWVFGFWIVARMALVILS